MLPAAVVLDSSLHSTSLRLKHNNQFMRDKQTLLPIMELRWVQARVPLLGPDQVQAGVPMTLWQWWHP